jgi:GMP synthase (glutamine-hydrolysing)
VKALAVRHVLFEDLGLIEPLLENRGYDVTYLEAGIDQVARPMEEADLLVVLGGPIGVGDSASYPFIRDEVDALSRRLDSCRPTLGICLGAQLMAAALGAEVRPTGRTEIGFGELDLTPAGLRSPLAGLAGVPVFHWHGDEFEIPPGCEGLASTEGFPNQAFSRGEEILGLQFHIEADLRYLERWLIGHSAELSAAGINPASLRRDAAACAVQLKSAAREVVESWLDA